MRNGFSTGGYRGPVHAPHDLGAMTKDKGSHSDDPDKSARFRGVSLVPVGEENVDSAITHQLTPAAARNNRTIAGEPATRHALTAPNEAATPLRAFQLVDPQGGLRFFGAVSMFTAAGEARQAAQSPLVSKGLYFEDLSGPRYGKIGMAFLRQLAEELGCQEIALTAVCPRLVQVYQRYGLHKLSSPLLELPAIDCGGVAPRSWVAPHDIIFPEPSGGLRFDPETIASVRHAERTFDAEMFRNAVLEASYDPLRAVVMYEAQQKSTTDPGSVRAIGFLDFKHSTYSGQTRGELKVFWINDQAPDRDIFRDMAARAQMHLNDRQATGGLNVLCTPDLRRLDLTGKECQLSEMQHEFRLVAATGEIAKRCTQLTKPQIENIRDFASQIRNWAHPTPRTALNCTIS